MGNCAGSGSLLSSPVSRCPWQVSSCHPSRLRAPYLLCNPHPGAQRSLLYETHSKHAEKERGEVWFGLFFFRVGGELLKFPWHWPQSFFPSLCSSVSARLALGDLGSFIPSLSQRKLLFILPLVSRAVANTTLAVSAAHAEGAPPDPPGWLGGDRTPPALWPPWGGPKEHAKSAFPRDAQAFC